MDEVEEKLDLITSTPLHYEARYNTIRFSLVKHFPYAIHFIVKNKKVIVLAVLGTR